MVHDVDVGVFLKRLEPFGAGHAFDIGENNTSSVRESAHNLASPDEVDS
jgi:hypothetical protein